MKSFIKYLTTFLLLTLAISAFNACSKSTADNAADTTVENNDNSAKNTENNKDYPAAPKAIVTNDLKSLDGKDFKLEDLKGDVLLVNLWATWCVPCIQEMPELVKLQEKYGDQGFKVIGLNSDEEDEAKVKNFVEKQNLNYKIGWADREVVGEFIKISKLPGIPQTLLIDREGRMKGMFRGGGRDNVEKMIELVDKEMNAS